MRGAMRGGSARSIVQTVRDLRVTICRRSKLTSDYRLQLFTHGPILSATLSSGANCPALRREAPGRFPANAAAGAENESCLMRCHVDLHGLASVSAKWRWQSRILRWFPCCREFLNSGSASGSQCRKICARHLAAALYSTAWQSASRIKLYEPVTAIRKSSKNSRCLRNYV